MIKRFHDGFSMIEVLVSLVIISVGVLGMVAMQSRTIKYTQDAVLQNNAAMLADELVELMRSNPTGTLTSNQFTSQSNYYKVGGTAFTTASGGTCPGRDRSNGGASVATTDIACWIKEVQANLPVTTALMTSSFMICPSTSTVPTTTANPCSGSASSSVVVIQIAWQDPSGNCASSTNNSNPPICIYRLRTEL